MSVVAGSSISKPRVNGCANTDFNASIMGQAGIWRTGVGSAAMFPARGSDEFDLAGREYHHPQQQHAVPPPLDIRLTIGAGLVAHRQIDDLKI